MAKKNLSKKVIGYIKNMIAAVLAQPENLNQSLFPEGLRVRDYIPGQVCSTPFCAAGHLIVAANGPKHFNELLKQDRKEPDSVQWGDEARAILGLVGEASGTLFGFASSWPQPYADEYYRATDINPKSDRDKAKAKVFAERWQHFIDTDGEGLYQKS